MSNSLWRTSDSLQKYKHYTNNMYRILPAVRKFSKHKNEEIYKLDILVAWPDKSFSSLPSGQNCNSVAFFLRGTGNHLPRKTAL